MAASKQGRANSAADGVAAAVPAVERVHAALTRQRGQTVAEIAAALGLGRSTVGKALVALESAGRAERSRGDRLGARRAPDSWRPAEPACPPEPHRAAATASTATAASGVGEATLSAAGATAPGPIAPVSSGAETVVGVPTDADRAVGAGSGRLGRGALRSLVAEFLAAHVGEEFTASRIGRRLGRSAGAVANALAVLAGEETSPLTRVGDGPRRYTHREPA
ncbi:hypothetical protein [Gandjariella thermophila]|uniref:Uncharacterized protein n=1 Tax=Gandjariella thermophila TaxID=1931992 RepID=A0A4D4JJ19_9PSEU|nr:hypothetical protein [Gandjariella thermophila]GDY33897.1 hypothetical protein GTS_55300 [Gandjariella thermophila]